MLKEKKKVAIIGTNGLPANYGGFETLAEYLTENLSSKFNIFVFCSSKSYNKKIKKYKGANLKYLPLKANGIESVFYDTLSIIWALFFADVLLILGVSGCFILPLIKLLSSKKIIVNIDGLEWKRDKWGRGAKKFLKFSERTAVKYADLIVGDNKVIQNYTFEEYGIKSELIAYGGNHAQKRKQSNILLKEFPFLKEKYAFKVCRIEPENNINIILEAFKENKYFNLVIIGNWNNSNYGAELKRKYEKIKNIFLIDPIYDQNKLDEIRSNCFFYIHGHSAGGTNPSLVEAMSLGLPIISFGVNYNKETTGYEALYFNTTKELIRLLEQIDEGRLLEIGTRMEIVASKKYNWDVISEKYNKVLV